MEWPREIAEIAQRWAFEPLEELPGGFCSRVFADQTRVLKVPFQGEEAISGWRMALAHSGTIGPEIFEHDPATGALLMERLSPGTKLSDSGLSEEDCLALVVQFHLEIQRGDRAGLMSLADSFEEPSALVPEMLATTTVEVALHGDLHHENILLDGEGWRVIDPKGLYGDPAFEAAAFMRNPIDQLANEPDLEGFLRARLYRVATAFNTTPWRVWGWTVCAAGEHDDSGGPWDRVRRSLALVEPERT